MLEVEADPARVLVVEPNAQLRSAIHDVLDAERYIVEMCVSLQDALARSDRARPVVALIAWQSMEGLLAEEHRHNLLDLTRRMRLVLMVPRRWARLLEQTDLGTAVDGLVPKPFEADELLDVLSQALRQSDELRPVHPRAHSQPRAAVG